MEKCVPSLPPCWHQNRPIPCSNFLSLSLCFLSLHSDNFPFRSLFCCLGNLPPLPCRSQTNPTDEPSMRRGETTKQRVDQDHKDVIVTADLFFSSTAFFSFLFKILSNQESFENPRTCHCPENCFCKWKNRGHNHKSHYPSFCHLVFLFSKISPCPRFFHLQKQFFSFLVSGFPGKNQKTIPGARLNEISP
jgi:hypothetical protein